MILTFLLSGSCLTMKMAHGLGWGLLVLPHLPGETCAGSVTIALAMGGGWESGRWGSRLEGESGEVSGPVGKLDAGEGEGWWGGG